MFRGRCASVRLACLVLLAVLALIALGPAGAAAQLSLPLGTLPDPTLLPIATTSQLPLTTVYNALNVSSIAAGGYYLDPTTGVKIYKLTSASFPTPSPNWGHDYSEGGDEVSLPYDGETRAVLLRQNGTSGGPWWLVDFTPGVGVSNPRQLTGILSPWIDLTFTFSNNPATPYYAYVSNGSSIIRFDIRTMTQADGDGWPITDSNATWLHQSENDGLFTWMRGVNGPTVVGYEPSTRTLKTYTNSGVNEPRIDRAGRYIGLSMTTPLNGLVVWDWQTNTIPWSTSGDPGIPFAHNASLRDRWVVVDWNLSFPDQFATFAPPVPNSGTEVGGPAPSTTVHGSGNWIQHPASGDLNDQWAVFLHYGSLEPTGSSWLAPGGMIFMTPNGQRRLLGHPYNATTVYNYFSFAKVSSDGQYVMFTSDMDGSGRSDVFLAEVPVQSGSTDTTPPTVSIASPGAGATVSGTITVSANATDNVGVDGVQFKLDGTNLGAEVTAAPYSVSWNTTTAANGSHILTAVARDAAGNTTTSAPVTVTVSNVASTNDTSPPTVSITAPASGSTVTGTVTGSANATDNVGVAGVQFKLDGANLGAEVTAAPYSVSWNTTTVANGTHTLTAVARDAAGNTATAAAVSVTVANDTTTTGFVGYWALDEGTGTTATDSSGNGNTGTLVNGPTWTAGRIGQGLAFDGLTNYVTVPSTAALNAYPLTVAVWMKTPSTTGVGGIVNKYVAGSYNGYQVFLSNGNLCAWYLRDTANYVYDGRGCPFNLPGYTDNQWHHVVYVVDASGGRLYVDGVQKGSLPWTGAAGPPSTTQPIHLAHYPGAFGGAEYFPGVLDDVRLYNRALSVAEILSLYAAADSTPPTVSITAPVSGATVIGTITAAASATDNVGVVGVQFKLDGANLGAEVTAAPYSVSWNTTTAANGAHTLTAVARDAAGNTATSSAVTVTVSNDLTAPVISGVAVSYLSSSGAVVTWTTDEGSDSQVEYGPTIAYGSLTPIDTTKVTAHAQTLSGLATGTLYQYRVKSRDAAGNLATSGDFTFTTLAASDITPPSVSMTAPASGSTATGTVTGSANATDNVGVAGVQFKLDGANLGAEVTAAPYSVSWNTTTAANGSHTLTAVARDAAGNTTTSAGVSVTVANDTTNPGLVGYWKLDEGSDTTATDSSGNGNTGTLMNGPTWTVGKLNYALSFDGLTNYVSIPHTAALDAYPLSVAGWMKTASTSGVRGIVNKYAAGSFNGYQLFLNNGNLCAWYLRDTANYVYDGGGCTFNLAGYNDNHWHHVAFVVDASGGRLYVDGLLKGSLAWTGTAGPPSTTQPIHLAHYLGAFGGAEYFPGLLDDVRIYNRALTAQEIQALSTGRSVENVVWTNLVNATATGNSLQKTSGCDGCADAGATSQQQILSGDGYLEFTASETGALRFAGLSTGNPGTSAGEITFAIRLQSGIAEVRESGVYRADTTFVTGEVFRVAVESGVVRYSKNGAEFYRSTLAPTYPLLVDTSLASLNATITNAVISGALSTASIDTTPPTVAITVPASGATVAGSVTLSASATDDVGVAAVQFKLDGTNLGAEVTIPPYALSWLTTTAPNGSHTLTAVASDGARNSATSASVTVTVSNDLSPPIISLVSAANISSAGATITWTTNEPSDSQVEYGPTITYGSLTPLDTNLVTAHWQTLSGLAANTWYHYRVKSRDPAGNLAISGDFVFKTTKR